METEHEDPLVRRRDELRRIVYGTRGDPPPDAAEELVRIEHDLAARENPDRAAVPATAADAAAAASAAPSDDDAQQHDEPPEWEEPRAPRRRPSRRKWVLVASVALVALALLVGPVRDLLSPPRGLDVFEQPQTEQEQDLAPQVATGAGLDADARERLRSLGDLFGYQFWAYREGASVCLLSRRQYFVTWEQTCSTVAEFGATPLVRRISTDDVRSGARPPRWQPGDVIAVSWGATSMKLEWEIEPAR